MGSTFYSKRYIRNKARNRKKRPKTFKSEDKAKSYAEKEGLKDFKIEMLNEDKYRVVA
ncbi:MAG: hypothetical protein ACOCZ6_02410 [Nanoarchaeota archaeon]